MRLACLILSLFFRRPEGEIKLVNRGDGQEDYPCLVPFEHDGGGDDHQYTGKQVITVKTPLAEIEFLVWGGQERDRHSGRSQSEKIGGIRPLDEIENGTGQDE